VLIYNIEGSFFVYLFELQYYFTCSVMITNLDQMHAEDEDNFML